LYGTEHESKIGRIVQKSEREMQRLEIRDSNLEYPLSLSLSFKNFKLNFEP